MKTGIELITEERQEQIEKHGYDADFVRDNPQYYSNSQMAIAATSILTGYRVIPENWPKEDIEKIFAKSWEEQLVIAGALIAAEIDRLQALKEGK